MTVAGGARVTEPVDERRMMVAMCRSIRTLREPYVEDVTEADIEAAALQYIRKVSGFRAPAPHNAEAFDGAVVAVAAATRTLLDQLVVRSPRRA